ncbi:MAG: hypothetical protein NC417_11100 [Candidatus Gastranaerophilales bacterium]|nr:hypothetical protein [Candidatus Gastranaerophilales bacterium]
MQTFFPELLDGFWDKDFLKKVCEKFHYETSRLSELHAVAEEMLPFLRREAVWEVRAPWIWEDGQRPTGRGGSCGHAPWIREDGEARDAVYEGVVMSLGMSLDSLQERYHKEERLTESYMLEVLSGELLLQGYQAYNRHVEKSGDWHVARYHFPGSQKSLPLKMLPHMLSQFSAQVSCNEAFCMLPKKSVVFLAELTQDETARCEGICVGCQNVRCANRMEESAQMERAMTDMPLTYGYQRIFGKW